jgi:hypothetical protein
LGSLQIPTSFTSKGIKCPFIILQEILRALPQLQYLGCPQLTLAQKPGQPKVVMPHVRTLCVRSNLSLNTLGAVEAPQLEKLDGHPPLEVSMSPWMFPKTASS